MMNRLMIVMVMMMMMMMMMTTTTTEIFRATTEFFFEIGNLRLNTLRLRLLIYADTLVSDTPDRS